MLLHRERVTGTVHHDHFVALDHTLADQFEQTREGHTSRTLHRDTIQLRHNADSSEGLLIADRLEGPPMLSDHVSQEDVGRPGAARGQRDDAGARIEHRLGFLQALPEGLHHRRASLGLDAGQLRHPVHQPHLHELLISLPDAYRPHTPANSLDVPIRGQPGSPPAWLASIYQPGQLLGNLEGDCLHTLPRCKGSYTAIAKQVLSLRKLGCDLFRLVVGAGDLDHLTAVDRHLSHLLRRHQAREESPELDACQGGIGRIGNGHVPRRGNDRFCDPHLLHHRHG